jgi:hypothetical protein
VATAAPEPPRSGFPGATRRRTHSRSGEREPPAACRSTSLDMPTGPPHGCHHPFPCAAGRSRPRARAEFPV